MTKQKPILKYELKILTFYLIKFLRFCFNCESRLRFDQSKSETKIDTKIIIEKIIITRGLQSLTLKKSPMINIAATLRAIDPAIIPALYHVRGRYKVIKFTTPVNVKVKTSRVLYSVKVKGPKPLL